jgi:hypothetical protein
LTGIFFGTKRPGFSRRPGGFFVHDNPTRQVVMQISGLVVVEPNDDGPAAALRNQDG